MIICALLGLAWSPQPLAVTQQRLAPSTGAHGPFTSLPCYEKHEALDGIQPSNGGLHLSSTVNQVTPLLQEYPSPQPLARESGLEHVHFQQADGALLFNLLLISADESEPS